ncbi:MAG: hypothetical protein ACK4MD_10000 [Demequina sp.]
MTDSHGLTYTTRKNGEVEIKRDGSMARMLSGDDAEDFLGQVKDGDADQVMKKFVDDQPGSAETSGTDTHPAMEDRLDGPVPHGDGEPREVDGEEEPTS